MDQRYAVVVADCRPLMREAICSRLQLVPRLDLVAAVDSALEAEAMVLRLRPRLLLIQGYLLANGQIEALHRLHVYSPLTAVVILGGNGLKPEEMSELLHSGHQWIPEHIQPDDLAVLILNAAANGSDGVPSDGGAPPHPQDPSLAAEELLTTRETQVLRLAAAGLSNRDIAERLVVSHYTVRNHVRSILTKLKVKNRTAASALVHAATF